MSLVLEITNGDQKGTRFGLQNGLVLGRKNADITLRDSKVSGRHAAIELKSDGIYWLIDLGSTNAIKLAGKRVRELRLKEGIFFTLGRTTFRVTSDATESVAKPSPKAKNATSPQPKPAPEKSAASEEKDPDAEESTWKDIVLKLAHKASRESRTEIRDISRFSPVVRLKFVRGSQTGNEWTLGYGPRAIGSKSLDLTLEEAGVPGVCFRLIPHHDGILFKVEADKDVKLNGRWVESEFLNDGDMIEIKNTQIQVLLDREA